MGPSWGHLDSLRRPHLLSVLRVPMGEGRSRPLRREGKARPRGAFGFGAEAWGENARFLKSTRNPKSGTAHPFLVGALWSPGGEAWDGSAVFAKFCFRALFVFVRKRRETDNQANTTSVAVLIFKIWNAPCLVIFGPRFRKKKKKGFLEKSCGLKFFPGAFFSLFAFLFPPLHCRVPAPVERRRGGTRLLALFFDLPVVHMVHCRVPVFWARWKMAWGRAIVPFLFASSFFWSVQATPHAAASVCLPSKFAGCPNGGRFGPSLGRIGMCWRAIAVS